MSFRLQLAWVALSLGAGCTQIEKLAVDLGLGPPEVQPVEIHDEKGASYAHDRFTRVLQRVVDEGGWVDYRALRDDPSELDAYIAELADIPYASLSRDHKMAALINGYNAFTLRLILDHYPVESIKDIPDDERWKAARWTLGGQTMSLHQIEHEKLREEFIEPRIHFAINCASVGCPPLARSAYDGDRLDFDLDRATQRVHDPASRWFDLNVVEAEIGPGQVVIAKVTRLYLWYEDDFGAVERRLKQWVPAFAAALDEEDRTFEIEYLPYDWSLNDASSRDATF